ncbi:hypothetical protein [Halalkalibacillus halophilus]|uniref:hypothetical protein n=1 Tax=Halalkalibacillus halophilus TaxID=392827 RepID=UPI0003FA8113|nr:hypothetical protein [Halalkalibacillus halophilus]
MNHERNKIIIDEIKHWKQSRLLPSEYCDFLLALYTFGEGEEEEVPKNKKKWKNTLFFLDLSLLLLLLPAIFLISFWFNDQLIIQLVTFLISLAIILAHIIYYKNKNSIYIHVPIVVFCLVFLISTISVTDILIGQGLALNLIILFHCLGWIIGGYFAKYYYLIASGIIGIVLILFFMFI